MDAETSLYIENIEEYVFDESRVVTYKWLSQTLEIHVNLAKRLLETFLKEQRKKEQADTHPLSVTYAVTGTQETKNGTKMTKVAVVNESGLEDAKSGMKEVLGQHVFSIQKSTLKDSSALFTTDYEITKQNITQTNRFSAIQCEAAQVRSREDAERLRESQKSAPSSEKPKINGFGDQHKSSTSSSSQSKPSKPTSSSAFASKPKKGSIAASFASQGVKNKSQETKPDEKKKSPEKSQEEKKKKEEVKKPKPKGMMAFMSQKPASSTTSGDANMKAEIRPTQVKEEEAAEELNVEEVEEEKPRRSEVTSARSEVTSARSEVTSARSTQRQTTTKSKKRADVSDSDSDDGRQRTVAKKRRRIIQQDSSSSEEEEEDMDDSPIPPTPPPVAAPIESDEEDEAPPTPKNQPEERAESSERQGSGRRRIRKRVLKSKVSVDEDGCMVTEKVWESESTDASEDEAPPPKQKSPPKMKKMDDSDDEGAKADKKKKKKTSPPSSRGKQSSLMSFFKKK